MFIHPHTQYLHLKDNPVFFLGPSSVLGSLEHKHLHLRHRAGLSQTPKDSEG